MMKFTLAWLKEHLDTDADSLGEIADKLTMHRARSRKHRG